MIDKTNPPRKIPYSAENIAAVLETALEHASHGWAALERSLPVNRLNPDSWPHHVEAAIGTPQYHLAIVLTALFEVYQSAHKETEHVNAVMDLVRKARGEI